MKGLFSLSVTNVVGRDGGGGRTLYYTTDLTPSVGHKSSSPVLLVSVTTRTLLIVVSVTVGDLKNFYSSYFKDK